MRGRSLVSLAPFCNRDANSSGTLQACWSRCARGACGPPLFRVLSPRSPCVGGIGLCALCISPKSGLGRLHVFGRDAAYQPSCCRSRPSPPTSSEGRRRAPWLMSAQAGAHQKTTCFHTKEHQTVSLLCFGASLVPFWCQCFGVHQKHQKYFV